MILLAIVLVIGLLATVYILMSGHKKGKCPSCPTCPSGGSCPPCPSCPTPSGGGGTCPCPTTQQLWPGQYVLCGGYQEIGGTDVLIIRQSDAFSIDLTSGKGTANFPAIGNKTLDFAMTGNMFSDKSGSFTLGGQSGTWTAITPSGANAVQYWQLTIPNQAVMFLVMTDIYSGMISKSNTEQGFTHFW